VARTAAQEAASVASPGFVGEPDPGGAEGAAAPRPLARPDERLGGSIAAVLACVARGAAIVRVHDVAMTKQAIAIDAAIQRARGGGRRA
jgi:dihydropteroate synthase